MAYLSFGVLLGRATQNEEPGRERLHPSKCATRYEECRASTEILTPAPTSIRRATGVLIYGTHQLSPVSDKTAIFSTESSSRLAPVYGTGNTTIAREKPSNRLIPISLALFRRTICICRITLHAALKANKSLVRSQNALGTGLDRASSCWYRQYISVHLRSGR